MKSIALWKEKKILLRRFRGCRHSLLLAEALIISIQCLQQRTYKKKWINQKDIEKKTEEENIKDSIEYYDSLQRVAELSYRCMGFN